MLIIFPKIDDSIESYLKDNNVSYKILIDENNLECIALDKSRFETVKSICGDYAIEKIVMIEKQKRRQLIWEYDILDEEMKPTGELVGTTKKPSQGSYFYDNITKLYFIEVQTVDSVA